MLTTKNSKYSEVATVLMDIECAMKNLSLWSNERPSEEALASTQPFCVDTLNFCEWLQFVFIEKLNVLVKEELALPEKCEVAPMAEEYFKQTRLYPSELVELLRSVDSIITNSEELLNK